MKKKSFAYHEKSSFGIIMVIILSFALMVSMTIAFFYTSDYANSLIEMSGKVDIEAVGKGEQYDSIEDTHTSNLIVTLSDGYNVLIPGMDISVDANCKVYRSTTRPLLRAKLDFLLTDKSNNQDMDNSDFLFSYINGKLLNIITENKWYLHSDGFFYYIGDVDQKGATNGNQLLQEVNATDDDVVIPFLDESFKFSTDVTSDYSGFEVKFQITFQAIQNFIANKDTGIRLANTITNSQIIFDDFDISYAPATE